MKQKKQSTEEIIRILRQADGDETVASICREHNISKPTFHGWRRNCRRYGFGLCNYAIGATLWKKKM